MQWLQRAWVKLNRRARAATVPPVQDQQLALLIAAPRSGTTWLKNALNIHPQVFASETRLLGNYATHWYVMGEDTPRYQWSIDRVANQLGRHFDAEQLGIDRSTCGRELYPRMVSTMYQYAREHSGKPFIIDKITPIAGTAPSVLETLSQSFPDTPVIWLTRDGRDVATSGVFDWLNKSWHETFTPHQTQRHRLFKHENDANELAPLDRFFEPDELAWWAGLWKELVQAEAELITRRTIHRIRFEDMLKDHRHVLHDLCVFLGLDHSEPVLKRCVEQTQLSRLKSGKTALNAAARGHIRSGNSGQWSSYMTRADGQQFHDIAGQALIEAGYERDNVWYEKLPKVLNIKADR